MKKTRCFQWLLMIILISVPGFPGWAESIWEDLSYPLNINEVSVAELAQIDGINTNQARAVLEFREQVGVIRDLRLLRQVKGIGERTMARLERNTFVSFKDQPIHPTTIEAQPATGPEGVPRIDLNRCDWRALQTVRGIGEKTARAIISFRDQAGPFGGFDELRCIKGLGVKRIALLKEKFYLPEE